MPLCETFLGNLYVEPLSGTFELEVQNLYVKPFRGTFITPQIRGAGATLGFPCWSTLWHIKEWGSETSTSTRIHSHRSIHELPEATKDIKEQPTHIISSGAEQRKSAANQSVAK